MLITLQICHATLQRKYGNFHLNNNKCMLLRTFSIVFNIVIAFHEPDWKKWKKKFIQLVSCKKKKLHRKYESTKNNCNFSVV